MLFKLLVGAWLTSIALQLVLGSVVVFKRMWRLFPIFTTYALFGLFQSALGFAIQRWPVLYQNVYICCETIAFMLGLGVIYEVFTTLLTPYPALTRIASIAFKSTVALLFSIAVAVIYFHEPVQGSRIVAGFVVLEQATRIAEVGLVVFLFSFASVFGLHWRQSIFGMTAGLAVFITMELIGITLRASFGNVAMPTFAVVRTLSFNCSLLIWLGYLLAPERVTSVQMPKRAQLEQWNQAIMELIHQ